MLYSHLVKTCEGEGVADGLETNDQTRSGPELPPWRKGKVPKFNFVEKGYLKDASVLTGIGEADPAVQRPVVQPLSVKTNDDEESESVCGTEGPSAGHPTTRGKVMYTLAFLGDIAKRGPDSDSQVSWSNKSRTCRLRDSSIATTRPYSYET